MQNTSGHQFILPAGPYEEFASGYPSQLWASCGLQGAGDASPPQAPLGPQTPVAGAAHRCQLPQHTPRLWEGHCSEHSLRQVCAGPSTFVQRQRGRRCCQEPPNCCDKQSQARSPLATRNAAPSLLPRHTRLLTAISQGCYTPYKAFRRSCALQNA